MRWRNRFIVVLTLGLPACIADQTTGPDLSPAAAPSMAASVQITETCLACVFGPQVFTRGSRAPATETAMFPADPAAGYIIDIDDGGSTGADGRVILNGVVLLDYRTEADVGPRHITEAVVLQTQNELQVTLTGKPGSTLTVQVLATLTPGGVLTFSDDFSNGLASWVEIDPDGLGTWVTQYDPVTQDYFLLGDYNIGCGSTFCNQTELLLANQFQPPANSNWRMEVRTGLVEAYCCYNGGAMVNVGKFSLWASQGEKEDIEIGGYWQGLSDPGNQTFVQVLHQVFPWSALAKYQIATSSWDPNTRQTVALERIGNEYRAYFNDILVYAVTRSFANPPKIGLHTYGTVKMADFKLYILP